MALEWLYNVDRYTTYMSKMTQHMALNANKLRHKQTINVMMALSIIINVRMITLDIDGVENIFNSRMVY